MHAKKRILIKVAPMSFRVKVNADGSVEGTDLFLNVYCRKFVNYKWNYIHRKYIADTIFRFYNKNTKELYLPIYDLENFKQFLTSNGYSYDVHVLPLSKGKKVDIKIIDEFKPKDDRQAQAIDHLKDAPGFLRALNIQTGGGKALPLDIRIKIPGGWTTMGELKVGDTITAWDGSPTKIIGVYPQGVQKAYEITFADGRKVRASGDHLWKSFYKNTTKKQQWRVRSTDELRYILTLYNNQVHIPLCEPEERPDVELPIPPYALGYLIGNGTLRSTTRISTKDDWVIEKFKSLLPNSLEIAKQEHTKYEWIIRQKDQRNGCNVWTKALREMGLIDKTSYFKFIPEEYLKGSIQQRYELLQGLMDSDGYVDIKSTCSFSTSSAILATQVQDLIRGLGGIAHYTTKIPKYSYAGEMLTGALSFNVWIQTKTPSRLFQLPRKKDRANDNNQYSVGLKLRVDAIEEVDACEMQCIKVDHPDSLFVCGDHVVTHNTAGLIVGAAELGVRTLIRVKGDGMIYQWVDAIKEYTDCTDDDIYVISGMSSVDKLLRGIDKKYKPKFIVASVPTLANYAQDKPAWSKFPDFDKFCDILKIGICATDEAHLNFHANYIIDLRLNCPITVPLTATFKVSDMKIREIFDMHYPSDTRFGTGMYNKYVDIYSVRYTGASVVGLPKSMFKSAQGYSHIKFEDWLLNKGSRQLNEFLDKVVLPLTYQYYINLKEPDEKMLILCSTTKMCEYYQKYLQREFKNLKINVYISGSPDEILKESDIIVSTTGSAGTGRDIKRLRFCLNTISMRSEPTNEQVLGRLRELRYSEVPPVYAYTHWAIIPSHCDHAQAREQLYVPLGKTFSNISYN